MNHFLGNRSNDYMTSRRYRLLRKLTMETTDEFVYLAPGGCFDQDAPQWGVGLSHALSRRTSRYTAGARIRNKHGAGYTMGNKIDAGSGDSVFNLGVRHLFRRRRKQGN